MIAGPDGSWGVDVMNGFTRRRLQRGLAGLVALVMGLAVMVSAPSAGAGGPGRPGPSGCRHDGCIDVRFSWIRGYDDPATPDNLDRVGILKVGSDSAPNVLVLNPGTSAGAGYFKPLAKDIVRDTHGAWQVWSVERRENQLEDQSMVAKAKLGLVTPQQFADYYLLWLSNPAVTDHFQLIPDSAVPFARGWGMNVEIQDLHRVVEAAGEHGRRVVMGGHSLGGSITTAYATWDFGGTPGAADLDGLIYIDGGSNPTPVSAEQAAQSLQTLSTASPWLAFGGIPAPFLGLFSVVGAQLTKMDPNGRAVLEGFPLLPANIVAPVSATNEAGFGYAVDADTSPPNLAAAQVHAGQLAATGDPRPWDRAGEITPIQRWASMLSGTGITRHDGSAWYHPTRLTIDAGAVAEGNVNPAQSVLDVKAVHGHDLDRDTLIYAFGAALGGQGVLNAASTLASQSGIPPENLTLVDRQSTYAHNDPSAASPNNEFVDNLIPFLAKVSGDHHHHRHHRHESH